jgi:hypothetical protein
VGDRLRRGGHAAASGRVWVLHANAGVLRSRWVRVAGGAGAANLCACITPARVRAPGKRRGARCERLERGGASRPSWSGVARRSHCHSRWHRRCRWHCRRAAIARQPFDHISTLPPPASPPRGPRRPRPCCRAADRPRARAVLEGLTLPLFLASLVVPHATVLYWLSNGAFALGLQAALSRPAAAAALGLPMAAVHARGEAGAAGGWSARGAALAARPCGCPPLQRPARHPSMTAALARGSRGRGANRNGALPAAARAKCATPPALSCAGSRPQPPSPATRASPS